MTEKTYVYNGKEVVMTGRVARPPGSGRKRDLAMLYEIRPVSVEDNDPNYCSWVASRDLYEITNLKPQEQDDNK